jgi:hypothetical protein
MAFTFDQMQVLTKTELGRRTIRERTVELPRPARTILLLVDGRSTVEKLRKFISATHAAERTLEDLEAKGLITRVAPPFTRSIPMVESDDPRPRVGMAASSLERFNALYELMCEVSATFLGLRGYFVQLKIERCENASQLFALKQDLVESIANRHGPEVAKEINRRIKELA